MAFGTLLLALALLILVGLLIALPLTDKKVPAVLPPTRRQQLEEARVEIIRGIRELDFDYKTGKLNNDDYKTLREAQVAQGAAILQQIDVLKPQSVAKQPNMNTVGADAQIEDEIQKRVAALSAQPVADIANAKSG